MNQYIPRYREKYPEQNFIPDDELINTGFFAAFAFNAAVKDCAEQVVIALKSDIDRISKYLTK